jgi:hypothetical protein
LFSVLACSRISLLFSATSVEADNCKMREQPGTGNSVTCFMRAELASVGRAVRQRDKRVRRRVAQEIVREANAAGLRSWRGPHWRTLRPCRRPAPR